MRTLSAFQPKGATGLNRGLVSYWRLDDVNDSVASYTLTNNGTTTFAAGLIGNCADFGTTNTTKSLSTTSTLGIDGGTVAISIWVKMRTEIGSGTQTFFENATSTGTITRYSISYDYNGGTRRLQFTRTKSGVAAQTLNYTVTLGTANWYHLVLTYDTTNIEGYVNGVSVGTAAASGSGSAGFGGTFIGKDIASSYASAYIDEVGLWNRVLSSTEVSELYNSGSGRQLPSQSLTTKAYYPLNGNPAGGFKQGAVAYYKLDDVNDSVGSYTLTNTNTVAFNTGFIGNGADFGTSSKNNKKLNRTDGLGVDMSGTIAFSLWTRIQTVPANGTDYKLIDWRSTTGTSRYVIIGYQQSGGVLAMTYDISGTIGTYTTTLSTASYSHIAFSCDASGNFIIYLNGSSVVTGSRGSSTSTNNFAIGGAVDTTTHGAAAYFDEVGVWSRTLTSSEITYLYNAGYGIQLEFRALDYSGNANHGTETAITYPQGRFGQGAKFNGSSSLIDCGDMTIIEGISTMTISTWIYPTVSATREMIVSKDLLANRSFVLEKSPSGSGTDNRVGFFIADGTSGEGATATNLTLNKWTNVILVYNASGSGNDGKVQIYFDGVKQALTFSTAFSGATIPATSAKLQIGAREYVGSKVFFTGLIDEVIIESRAWTAKEVETYYRKSTLNYRQKSFADRILIALLQAGAFVLSGKQMTGARAIVASLLKGAFTFTGKMLSVPSRWVSKVKNTSTWGSKTKNSSTWTSSTKNSSTWTSKTKN